MTPKERLIAEVCTHTNGGPALPPNVMGIIEGKLRRKDWESLPKRMVCWECAEAAITTATKEAQDQERDACMQVAAAVGNKIAQHEHPYTKRDGFFAALGTAEEITATIRARGGK